ncbi:hypothetical protein Clacol_010218 [Clathrus columnatus]|uniref:Sulfotransferase family protein n=1 Tax=Clathrus columnatus TaxID=1419009 RepID=A0AAV5AT51_9AGAM|nr:hypothetical protein Clacol_010218 [Clathrus columnatus]
MCRIGSNRPVALNRLGFGPCYHILLRPDNHDLRIWYNVGQDYPVAINFEKLYKAYPDAKFILTIRDPAKWEASTKETLSKILAPGVNHESWEYKWFIVDAITRYHRGRFFTNAQDEIIAHNQRIIETISADQLLVYEVSQGWEPLVDYLGVEKPDIPFPRVNETAKFPERIMD